MALNNQYSVIIPVKNGEQFIKNSIESILTQTLPPFEIIVVNDHSIDSTTSLVSKEFPEVSIINSGFDGQARAIVVGLEKVKTPYVALLDSDDIWEPTKQEIQINVLNEKPELSVVCSGVRNFLSNPSEKTDVSLNAKLFHQSRQFSACTFHTEVLRSEVPLDLEKKHFDIPTLPDFPIKGGALEELGFVGPEIGKLLDMLYRVWLDNLGEISVDELLKIVKLNSKSIMEE
jgi:glycosyltransferase involved in cell wall biosynthesis